MVYVETKYINSCINLPFYEIYAFQHLKLVYNIDVKKDVNFIFIDKVSKREKTKNVPDINGSFN